MITKEQIELVRNKTLHISHPGGQECKYCDAIAAVLSTAENSLRETTKLIELSLGDSDLWLCSHCRTPTPHIHPKFCPECGYIVVKWGNENEN